MARFTYNTSTPMGQIVSESVNHMQEALAKITRSSGAVTLMGAEEMESELGVPQEQQAGFRSALNQLKKALEGTTFSNLLPQLDQG